MNIETEARRFWSAAFFIRRAPDRDHREAVRILRFVTNTSTGRVHDRALALLREINEQQSSIPEN